MADFCDSDVYTEALTKLRAGALGAREVAELCLAHDQHYHGYVFLLFAADAGDDEAADELDMLSEIDHVCDEDVQLAELQAALWYHHGHVVARDDARAAEHLPMAAFPFLSLPSAAEIAGQADVTAFRDKSWADALVAYGIPSTGDRAAVAATLARIVEDAGWPATLDVTRPLGPAMPDRPHNLHHRHPLE